jgi:membrane protease YdiL (CAAX protease family)
VLLTPAAILSQGLVIAALHVAPIGHGHPVAISLALDAAAYGANLGLVGLFLGVRRGARFRDVGLALPRWPWLLAALPVVILAYAVERPLGELGSALLPSTPNNQCLAIHTGYGSALALGLIEVGLLAPVAEEIFFRGVLFGWLRGRVPVAVAVVLSAAAFSVGHLDWMQWSILLPTFGAGCVLAVLYHYSRSLWPCIVVHGLSNTIVILVVVLGHVHC